jgi:hypothetical protein
MLTKIPRHFSTLFLSLLVCGSLAARPEQAIPAGDADMVILVDLDRPVQLVAGVQAMTADMILSIADKCEDPQDAKAALCLRRLRSGIEKAHSMAMYLNGDIGFFVLEADLTDSFDQKLKSVSSLRSFGRYKAYATTFGALWGDEAGSMKEDTLVIGPGGRLLIGDDAAIAKSLQALAGRSSYLPTFGRDSGFHYLIVPSVVGLEAYEELGARRLIMDFKVGEDGRDSFRCEIKCDSASQAAALRPRVISDYIAFFSPSIHKMLVIKEPGLTLKQVQSRLRYGIGKGFTVRDNSIIIEFADQALDMNPQQFRVYIEDMIVMAFKGDK